MERNFAYSGAIPLNTDLMLTNLNAYIGLSKLAAAVLGINTIANGLSVAPATPANLTVIVAPGELYSLQECDPTAYGDVGTNTFNLVKQGVNQSSTTVSLSVPATSGYSQNYLIEFGYSGVDGDSQVLNYYNAANPSSPLSGPGGSGAPNNTVRFDNISITAKAGVAAPTGTQATPTPDTGAIGGYVVTVANGQTQITSGNITLYSAASFINETLTQKISQTTADARYAQQTQIQAGTLVLGTDTGTVNAVIAMISPAISNYTKGMEYNVVILNTNTGASTGNLNSIGNKNIILPDGRSTYPGALTAGMCAKLFYDGTNLQLLNAVSKAPNLVLITSTGTYTPTVGIKEVFAEIVGGAGGSASLAPGAGTNTGSVGGGAGSGGVAAGSFTAAQIGVSQSVTIGAAGSAGTTGGNPGGNGGNSALGSLLAVGGGVGGTCSTPSTTYPTIATGGNGGTATTGAILIPGQAGTSGLLALLSDAGSVSIPGTGGSPGRGFGLGGAFGQIGDSGYAATGYGAGPSGGIAHNCVSLNTGNVAGTAGQPGACLVTEYF